MAPVSRELALLCCSKYSLNHPNADAAFSFCLVQEPDPNQPKPEGPQMSPLEGEQLGVVNKWPPSLPAALQRWGTTQPKSPCLTALDNAGKPVYTLTYGRYQPVVDRPRIYTGDAKQYHILSFILCGLRTFLIICCYSK